MNKKIAPNALISGLVISTVLMMCPHYVTAAALSPTALVEAAHKNNPDIEALEALHLASQYRVETVGRYDDPSLLLAITPNTVDSTMGTRGVVQISQKLPWPGKRLLERKIARSDAKLSVYDVEMAKRELSYTAKYFWAEWWYIDQALLNNKKIQALYEQLLNTALTQYENGTGLQQDLLTAQTQLMHTQHQAIVLLEKKS